eukprot:c29323_g5_i9 orf=764-2788(+)
MDFSHNSVGLSSGNLNFRDRSLSGLTTERGDSRHRMPGLPMSPGSSAMLSPNNLLNLYRTNPDMDLDFKDDCRGPMKLARTDSFINRQPDLKMQMANSGTLGSLVRSNSMLSDCRPGSPPTHSSPSDAALLGNETNFISDPRLIRNESIIACPQYFGGTSRSQSFHHQACSFRPSGLPLSMGREIMNQLGLHDVDRCSRHPFTLSQLRELQHHALIFKYMLNGLSVPTELIIPIRNSVVGLSRIGTGPHPLSNIGWGGYHLGFANNNDPEPGRCRRTDGKKWRCSQDVVPGQKYCERHMHRGRHRSRRPNENQTASSQSPAVVGSSSACASQVCLHTAPRRATPSSLHPAIALNSHSNNTSSGIGVKPCPGTDSPSGLGGISVDSSMDGSHFQLAFQSAASGTTGGLSPNDYRYMNGLTKPEIDLGPEQIFFSEASGSVRGISQESHSIGGLSMLSSVNNSWSCPISSKQQALLGSGFGAVESVTVSREAEGQPLRHFFDDWPRSRDPAALSWPNVEEDRSNRSSSTTQLSISIPMASTDFTAAAASSPRGKLSLSPLKLSMSRAGDDDPLGVQMGLGVGMGLSMNEDRHQQTNWIPITWETPVGGPLAEVLQSSTPRGCKSSGLNLMTDGWDNSPRASPRMASSPTGVLQNATFGSISDCSSGSSPRATKTQP